MADERIQSNFEETFSEKALRKTIENPLVPLGAALTLGFLITGFKAFQRGDKKRSQILMRGRVAAQAFTVIAMGAAAFMGLKPHDRPTNVEQKLPKQENP